MTQTTVQPRYQVIARIAAGGMGEVFRARDTALGRDVAIKVLHRNLASDEGFIDRFRQEARSAARLSHPNIVAVHDWGSTPNGTYFMVMEYVHGRTVRDLITAYGRLQPAHVSEILLQVLAALDHAHAHGIVHRDVKPENILITEDGKVKVADFGLARAFAESRVSQAPGTVTGTVQYLAPEQIQGEPADPRTDLYALGVSAYEMLTGRVPYMAETSLGIAYMHLKERVPRPSENAPGIPKALDRIVLSATEKERGRRPPSAAAMRKDVLQLAGKLTSPAPLPDLVRDAPGHPAQSEQRAHTVTIPQPQRRRRLFRNKPRRKRSWRRWLAAIVLLAILGSGGWVAWQFFAPKYSSLPSVVGLPQAVAQERLEGQGFEVDFGPPTPSLRYAPGEIVEQQPSGGSRVREGSEILLRPSAGLPLRLVPQVEGKTEDDARVALEQAGLMPGIVRKYSETVAAGLVIEQNPGAGQRIQHNSRVELTISDGPKPIPIPKVAGFAVAEAKGLLAAKGFEVEVKREHSLEVPEGDVIRQRPDEGNHVRGSLVTIWISLGPRTFPMPNVVGMGVGAAEDLLVGEGLDVNYSDVPHSSDEVVLGQLPGPGVTVEEGQSVDLFV